MNQLYNRIDFEAIVEIYSEDQGGRTHPVFNGIRWDLVYAEEDLESLSAVWPDFFDRNGYSLIAENPLPVGRPLNARFFISAEGSRNYHRNKMEVGTQFFCHEGPRRVARGEVTRIIDL